MADSYVCSGATMRCTMGEKPAKLTVLPTRTVFLCGQPMANISDHKSMVNLAPFGRCRSLGYPATAAATAAHHGHLTPMPCVHNTPVPWMPGKSDYIVKGQPALLKSCKCQCMWGGTISLTTDGQAGEGTQYVNKSGKASAEEILDTANEKNGLTPESVLDGIQLALDVAGFVPGFGAIPDLMNAGIYALRGNWVDAGMSLLAAVPGIGDVAAGAKMAKRGFNIAKAAKKSVARNIDLSKEVLMKRGMTAKQAVTYRRAVRNERRNVARKFYKDNTNWPDSKIEAHLHGIDYDKPVIVDKIPPSGKKEVTVYQYRKLDATGRYEPGNYFTLDANATPSELGIADTFTMNVTKAPDGVPQQLGLPFHKEKFVGTVSSEVPCLRSTSKKIEDTWSMAGERIFTKGGGEQLFIPNNGFASKMIKY